jgi:hypothetical protein
MKVFTFFYNRYKDATTSIALYENGIKHNVLCHNSEQADQFLKHGTSKGNLVVTGAAKGLAYQRNAALDMMNVGEWAAFMCDDFMRIQSFPKEFILSTSNKMPVDFDNQHNFRLTKKDHSMSLAEFFTMFPKLIEIAETNKIHLIGFKAYTQPMGFANKFSTRGLADGRFWLVKKTHDRFDLGAQLIDDICWTARNLIHHGNVLVLNWSETLFKRYTEGGFGSTKERMALRIKECQYLEDKYFPLIQIAPKKNWVQGSHVKISGSDKNIKLARQKLRIGIYEKY